MVRPYLDFLWNLKNVSTCLENRKKIQFYGIICNFSIIKKKSKEKIAPILPIFFWDATLKSYI